MTASAWVNPPGFAYQARQNEQLPVASQLRAARPGAVAVAAEGLNHPAMAALRTSDEVRPWEVTALPNRCSTTDLLFMSSSWLVLRSGVDEQEVAS